MSTDKFEKLLKILERRYSEAEKIVNDEKEDPATSPHIKAATQLANVKHAFRGAAVTLLSYKLLDPAQDIRAHKDEQEGGFSARTYDTRVTIPFLIDKSLPRNVESHWLTQTLSFAGILHSETQLKTQPKSSGPLLVEVVNFGQELDTKAVEDMLTAILVELIKIRNKDRVILTRPKRLPIHMVTELLNAHFHRGYKSNGPRLPQLAVYAIYKVMIPQFQRFNNQKLDTLQRMKAADRKAGTVGDIVVLDSEEKPTEAVEIKFGQMITDIHVCEAIEKVRGASVSRYYLLSTNGIDPNDEEIIRGRRADFLVQNGCEIIVNGVVESIAYYLRLLPNTTDFVSAYADLVESDDDTAYEHRISWNEICAEL